MKKFNLILIFAIIISFHNTYAQEQGTNKVHSARVFKISDNLIVEGYLYQLKDSTISVSSLPLLSSPTVIFHEIDIHDINKVEIRKKRKVGERILIGALSGFAIGGIIGYATGGNGEGFVTFSKGESALMGGILFGIGGGLIYGLSGGKVDFIINGNRATYDRKKGKMKKYLLAE